MIPHGYPLRTFSFLGNFMEHFSFYLTFAGLKIELAIRGRSTPVKTNLERWSK
jgi:hypothetical protein